ncbi:MAG: macro domain-containing protein, partial [Proteobacteria bacterium]|nr:macro domain-containing protein [Pseudomonadota bacterium]
TLYFTVLNCLRKASKENLSSVAFPAISTGVFGMPEDICAKASLKAVLNYLQGNQNSTVTAIRFVLYTPMAFQAFKSSFKSIILPCATTDAPAAVSSSGQWLWANDSGSFSLYSPTTAAQLTQEFSKNPSRSFQCLINGKSYVIDFATMTQTNISTNYQRKIRFDPSSSAAATMNQAVQWQYSNDQHLWSSYQPNESQTIETMYQANTRGNMTISGRVYTFDFTNMLQINTQTGYQRNIHRILSPLVPGIAAQQQPPHEETK